MRLYHIAIHVVCYVAHGTHGHGCEVKPPRLSGAALGLTGGLSAAGVVREGCWCNAASRANAFTLLQALR
jgi:hypothetical protein